MPELATLRACDQAHVIHYPSELVDLAAQTMQEIAFCSTCECGTVHFVVVWPCDRTRIMQSGDAGLFERFEAMDWPESPYVDEHGLFLYRSVPNSVDVALFLHG